MSHFVSDHERRFEALAFVESATVCWFAHSVNPSESYIAETLSQPDQTPVKPYPKLFCSSYLRFVCKDLI